jgi:hypothetical protein
MGNPGFRSLTVECSIVAANVCDYSHSDFHHEGHEEHEVRNLFIPTLRVIGGEKYFSLKRQADSNPAHAGSK